MKFLGQGFQTSQHQQDRTNRQTRPNALPAAFADGSTSVELLPPPDIIYHRPSRHTIELDAAVTVDECGRCGRVVAAARRSMHPVTGAVVCISRHCGRAS